MKPLTFFKFATFLLLALNLGLITFFFVTKPPHPPHQAGLRERAHELLQLDSEQHDAFMLSAENHRAQMMSMSEEQSGLLRPYFERLIDSSLDLNVDSIRQHVQNIEWQKMELTYRHFSEVSALAADPHADFRAFLDQALARILPDLRRGSRPPL